MTADTARWAGELISPFAVSSPAPEPTEAETDQLGEGPFSVEGELLAWAAELVQVPRQVRDAFGQQEEGQAVGMLVDGGVRDEEWLTNLVFHARHRELAGRPVEDEPALAAEWQAIREGEVRPRLLTDEAGVERAAGVWTDEHGGPRDEGAGVSARRREDAGLRPAKRRAEARQFNTDQLGGEGPGTLVGNAVRDAMARNAVRAAVLFSVEGELESWADSVARLPAQVRKAIEDGQGELAARLLVAGGERRVNWLTNVVFHTRHKWLKGREIRPGETDLARKWLEIRRDIVRPMLRAPVPVSPSPPVASQTFPVAPAPTQSMAEWRQRALEVAGINPGEWLPGKGFKHNKKIVERVYAYYMGLFNSKKELMWAGMAKLAGGAVYGGLLEAQMLVDSFGFSLHQNPDPVSVKIFNTAVALQKQLMTAQRAIFDDLAWQHQAYVELGLRELEALATSGVDVNAWRDIASGEPGRVRKGNKALLRREQEVIVAPYYAAIRAFKDFDQVPKQMSSQAESPVPDGRPFRVVVPGGDLTVFADRWKWIETDMLPAYERLTPERRRQLVNHPLSELAKRRWPPG